MPDLPFGMQPTPDPQSFAVKAAKIQAEADAYASKRLGEFKPPTGITVTNIDGKPTVIASPSTSAPAGQLVTDDEMRLMGEEPIKFPPCEFPKCDNPAQNTIQSGAGKPLSINRKGELVFGKRQRLIVEGLSPREKTLVGAGLQGVVGPSGVQPAVQSVKSWVRVCEEHKNLPHAPKAPERRYKTGPYPSYILANARAAGVSTRTAKHASVQTVNGADGTQTFFVLDDDGMPGYKGKLREIPEGKRRA